MNDVEFERLLRSQALGALLPAERQRLDALASAHPGRARLVAEQDAVLAAFAGERHLTAEVTRPAAMDEDADEAMQRLARTAAAAEQELRARLVHGTRMSSVALPRDRWRRPLGFALLAAAAALLLWFGLARGDGPGTRPPEDLRSGTRVQLVLYNPTLTPEARAISWAAVAGASGYDVAILDRDGEVVLERAADQRKSTVWELTPDQYSDLRARLPLRVRVTALDGVGAPIGSSGDLELGMR